MLLFFPIESLLWLHWCCAFLHSELLYCIYHFCLSFNFNYNFCPWPEPQVDFSYAQRIGHHKYIFYPATHPSYMYSRSVNNRWLSQYNYFGYQCMTVYCGVHTQTSAGSSLVYTWCTHIPLSVVSLDNCLLGASIESNCTGGCMRLSEVYYSIHVTLSIVQLFHVDS